MMEAASHLAANMEDYSKAHGLLKHKCGIKSLIRSELNSNEGLSRLSERGRGTGGIPGVFSMRKASEL